MIHAPGEAARLDSHPSQKARWGTHIPVTALEHFLVKG